MSKITRSARLHSCTLRLQGCLLTRGTVVFAHAPSTASGTGHKSPDFWGAYACASCHDIVDGRKASPHPKDVISERWLAAIFETQSILHESGLLIEA